jgi:hemolysin activation/secretion protein
MQIRKHYHRTPVMALLLAGAGLAAQAQAPAGTAAAADEEARFTVTGFSLLGDNPLPADLTERTLAPFAGEHTGIERLQQAALALEALLRERGFGFYRVVLPPQDIGGVIKLEIFRFTLGTIEVKGNQFFANENILASVPQLVAGVSPNTQQLARDLAVANENPSKRANVTFKQGTISDTIDATIDVTDSRTVSAFLSASNIGNLATGHGRVTAGISHANLFDRDHQATLTYTTSPSDPGKVHQYGGYYRMPVYASGGIASAYYTRSSVNSGTVANLLNVTGRGAFFGVQYTHYFAPERDYRAYLSVALDDKHFINEDITTIGGAALVPNYRTRPVTVSYTGRMEQGWGLWGYNVDFAHNLPMGGGNDAASYAANRAGARTGWSVARFGGDATVVLGDGWLLSGRLKTQFSGAPLVPGEQFGVGGAQSVRGLNERVLAGDTGYQASVEVWTPAVAPNTRLLAFYDRGQVRNHDNVLLPIASASSFGVGVRWNQGTSLSASLDFAHVLSGLSSLPAGTPREKVHFNVNWRY